MSFELDETFTPQEAAEVLQGALSDPSVRSGNLYALIVSVNGKELDISDIAVDWDIEGATLSIVAKDEKVFLTPQQWAILETRSL